jgi:hypothetical protein
MQVHNVLRARLGSSTARMIVPVAHGDASPAVGDIGQMEAEHLTGPQAAIEHQTHHGKITPGAQLQQQPRDLLGIKWSRQPAWCSDPDRPG